MTIPFDENFHLTRTGPAMLEDWKAAGRTVGDDAGFVVHPAEIERDVVEGGLSYEESFAKHRAKWRAQLAGPAPAPGPSPDPGPLPPSTGPLRGAFCLPIPGARVWQPAFLAVSPEEQNRYIYETRKRRYNFMELLVSGKPYRDDYPNIEPNADVLRAGLLKCKDAGLQTIVAFDDTRWPDLSYLRDALAPSADLIDWAMGIYEVNGVVRDAAIVLDLLKQTRAMLPSSRLAVHFTDLAKPGQESYGLVDWKRAKAEAGLNALFFQASAWVQTIQQIDDRVQDYTRRLMAGMHGYPILSDGVYLFELTTSKTYRDEWTEAQGVTVTDALMSMPLKPDENIFGVRPSGFCDGGTV